MKNFISFVRQRWYLLSVLLILLISIFFRFYNYENRWGLAYDQSHDAVLARYAVEEGKIPLLGPFSSAGPFQTGGEWYWLLMIPIVIYPFSVLSPWIFITSLYVLFVFIIIEVGRKLESRAFGVIVGLLAAVSTAQIAQAVNLTNQSPHAINGLLAIFFMINYVRSKKIIHLFAMCFFISLSASIHLQGVGLLMIFISTILFTGIPHIKYFPILLSGFIIPLLPIIIYDFSHDFFNIKNMVQYYLHDQYNISLDVLGRRWLTYGGVFIPKAWAHVIGGYPAAGYAIMVSIFFASIYVVLRGKLKKEWVIIFFSLMMMIVLLRYTRTPLFDSYLVFMHPFIVLLTGYVLYLIFQYKKVLGVVLVSIVILTTAHRDMREINGGENFTATLTQRYMQIIINKYPNESFAIYDRGYQRRDKSVPLVMFLHKDRKISAKGRKIGITIVGSSEKGFSYPVLIGEKGEIQLFDLNSASSNQLTDEEWVLTNPREIYNSTEEWYTK